MNDFFYQKYKNYETFPIEEMNHLADISFYNHNYYVGLQRANMIAPDLIYAETDEFSEVSEYYHVEGNKMTHIGYAYIGDKFITLQEEELT